MKRLDPNQHHECQQCSRMTKGGFVCRDCAAEAIPSLRLIADLCRHADDKRARFGSSWRTGATSRATEQPLPYDPRVTAVMASVTRTLRRARDAAEEVQPARVRCEDTAPAIASWLTSRMQVLRRHPGAKRHLDAIGQAETKVEELFDRPPERVYLGSCGELDGDGVACGTPLYVAEGHTASVVACPKCKHETLIDSRRVELAAGVANYHGTVKETSRLLRETLGEAVTVAAIYAMARAELITPAGHRLEQNGRGEWREVATYRIGDVRDAAARAAADKETQRALRRAARQEQSA